MSTRTLRPRRLVAAAVAVAVLVALPLALAQLIPGLADTPPVPLPLKLTTLDGGVAALHPAKSAATVVVFLSADCPISNKYIPELNRLAKVAGEKNVAFYGVISDAATTRADAVKHRAEFKIAFPQLFDASGTLAAALKPTHTPHAFVILPDGSIPYAGRIDDAVAAVTKPNAAVTSHDLENAIAAVAAGKAIVRARLDPVGCLFEGWDRKTTTAATAPAVTYTRDIAPLLNANCVTCHREGEVAPFPLTSYKDASKRAKMLAMVTGKRIMPPWKSADALGTFRDERHLTDAEIALFKAWADAGAPEGNATELPPQPKFPEGWQLGEPDLVVKMPKPFDVPAAGKDIIRYFVLPIDVPEDKYVVGFQYKPGNPKVVHHMIAFLDSSGKAREVAKTKGDGTSYASFGGPGFTPTGGLGGWAPGSQPHFLPDGSGRKLKKGSDLVMQLHYHPSGKEESDQGSLALYFAKAKPKTVAIDFPLTNPFINIPPGEANYVRTATITTPVDVTVFGVMPHMHNVGRTMKATATFKDGTTRTLIDVRDWDWNWQEQYQYTTPVKLPAGTKVTMEATFDNSDKNPRNPNNPPKAIRFGEQTTDEMCLLFLQLTVDGPLGELLLQRDNPRRGLRRGGQ